MAISADSGTGGGLPFAKFTSIGDELLGAFASKPRECQRQRRKYKTGEPITRPGKDGKQVPALEEIMWFIAMPGTTAKVGTAETEYTPIMAGDTVRWSVSGFQWGQVIDARKKLPARAGFKAGEPCSGDVYSIRLASYSVGTENARAAERAGFTVVDGRIVMTTEEQREKYVMHQVRNNGNTSTGKDFVITIRRPEDSEKRWEQAADELFASKPWEKQLASVGGGSHDAEEGGDEEPF